MNYFHYYGIDWLAMVLANIIFFSMNVSALVKWTKPDPVTN